MALSDCCHAQARASLAECCDFELAQQIADATAKYDQLHDAASEQFEDLEEPDPDGTMKNPLYQEYVAAKDAIDHLNHQTALATISMMRRALADYEEKHGMDHPTTARMAWSLSLQLDGEDKEALLMRAATVLLDCPGPAHGMTFECLVGLHWHLANTDSEDSSGDTRLQHSCNHIQLQMVQAFSAGCSAGTAYLWADADSPDYEALQVGEYDYFFNLALERCSLLHQGSLLLDLVAAAERQLGADHLCVRCFISNIWAVTKELIKELDADASAHDEAGLEEGDGSAQQALQSEDDQVSEVSEVSQASVETLAASAAKHSMACRLARLGLAVLARSQPTRQPAVDEEAEQQGTKEDLELGLTDMLHTLEHCMIA